MGAKTQDVGLPATPLWAGTFPDAQNWSVGRVFHSQLVT
jgi:hypothetical protein